MRAFTRALRRPWALVICVGMMACRGDQNATPIEKEVADVVLQFYTMRDALGGTGAPSSKELDALRPFISDRLARGLASADSIRSADIARAPNEKPRFVEGDLFSSMFEGPTGFRVMPVNATTLPMLVRVEFTNDKERPVLRWTDTVVVARYDGRWQVHDIRYGGTWAFGNKGSLLGQLTPSP